MDDDRPAGHQSEFALALSHHRAGRHEEAASACRAILASDAAHPAALYLYGLVRFAMGATEDAIGLMRSLVALRPANALGQAALARLLTLAGRPAETTAPYRAALALSPADAELAAGLAHALLVMGRNEEAIAALDPLLERVPLPAAARAEALFLRGVARKALEELAPAIADFRDAIAAGPRHAAWHLDLGNCLAAIGQAGAARRELERAIAIDPTLKEAHASLGSMLLLAGEESAAERAFGRALALDPDMALAHQSLAAICDAAGRTGEAARHRDAAYRRQNVFVEPAGRKRLSVLLLTSAAGGNVPTKFLFPRRHCTLVKWVIAYAQPGQEEALPPYDLVFNGIGDPDAAAPTRASVTGFLERARAPVLNPPHLVHRTRRDLLPDLLESVEAIVVPPVRRLAGASPPAGALRFPLLLRRAGSHGGQGVRLVASEKALAAAWPAGEETLYLTEFRPFRSADGMHRKYRMIFIDRRPYPYHLAIASHWLVHYATSGMEADPAKCREERSFLEDPERALGTRAMAGIRRIGERLALDFAGVDFSVLPDGRVLVFEANATMLVHPEDETGPLAYRNTSVQRILNAFDTMTATQGLCLPAPPANAEAGRVRKSG